MQPQQLGQPAVFATVPLYPVLENMQTSDLPSSKLSVSGVQQVAAPVIRPQLLPQPPLPPSAQTQRFPATQKTPANPPLVATPYFPAVMPGSTAHYYTKVPPPPVQTGYQASTYAQAPNPSFPAVQRAPANPPVVHLQEAPLTRGTPPSFPAVQRTLAQQATPPAGQVLHEAPKGRPFHY